MIYPTHLLPKSKDMYNWRLSREVMWLEMYDLAKYNLYNDVLDVCSHVACIYKHYKSLKFNIKELLSFYSYLDPTNPATLSRDVDPATLSPDKVDWGKVPPDMMARCLDENFDLQVTQELIDFLYPRNPIEPIDTNFAKYDYPKIRMSVHDERLIRTPLKYYDDEQEMIASPYKNKHKYFIWDEETGTHRRVTVSPKHLSYRSYNYNYHEVDYVINHLTDDETSIKRTGLPRDIAARIVRSIDNYGKETRKRLLDLQYKDEYVSIPLEAFRAARKAIEQEVAISKNGKYTTNTQNIWRILYGKYPDI